MFVDGKLDTHADDLEDAGHCRACCHHEPCTPLLSLSLLSLSLPTRRESPHRDHEHNPEGEGTAGTVVRVQSKIDVLGPANHNLRSDKTFCCRPWRGSEDEGGRAEVEKYLGMGVASDKQKVTFYGRGKLKTDEKLAQNLPPQALAVWCIR